MTPAWRNIAFRPEEIALIGVAVLLALAVVWLPLKIAVGLAGGAAIIVLTLAEPVAGLALTLILAPLAAYTNFVTGAVLRPLDTGQVMLALALGAWLLRSLARREIRLYLAPVLWPLAALVGWATLSLLWAGSYSRAIPEVIKWAEIVLVAAVIVDLYLTGKRRTLVWVLAGLLASGAFQAALGIWQARLRGIGPETFMLAPGIYRAYGSFEQPNPYAGYLGLAWPVAAGLALGLAWEWWTARKSPKLLPAGAGLAAGLTAAAGLGALVLSWSRGAWLGGLGAVAAMAAGLPRRIWLGVCAAALAGLALLGADSAGLLPASIRARLTDVAGQVQVFDVRGVKPNDANYSVIERLAHWQAAGEMIRQHPWTGVGFSNYETAYPQYALMRWPIPLGHAHNYYLNITAELGIPGLFLYLLMWGTIYWQTARALWQQHGWQRGLALGFLGAWTHLAVHNVFDNLYVNNTHLLIGAMIGVLAVLNLKPMEGQS